MLYFRIRALFVYAILGALILVIPAQSMHSQTRGSCKALLRTRRRPRCRGPRYDWKTR